MKIKILVGLALLVTAFAVGRFTTPAKVETHETIKYQTQIQYQDRVVTQTQVVTQKVYVHDSDSHKHVATTTTEITKPDGTKIKTIVSSTDTQKESKTNTDTNTNQNTLQTKVAVKTETTQKEDTKDSLTIYDQDNWHIGLLAGVNITKFELSKLASQPLTQISFGGEVDRRIVGPVYVGAFGLSDGTIGLTLSLGF
jgi:hypothetical protein